MGTDIICLKAEQKGAGNATKLLQTQNEPKTNPNEPNFSEDKTHSKPKNGDFRQIYENLFMQNEPNGMFTGKSNTF